MDALNSEVKVKAGEPYKVKIPIKGSPIPTSQWYNVSRNHCFYCTIYSAHQRNVLVLMAHCHCTEWMWSIHVLTL